MLRTRPVDEEKSRLFGVQLKIVHSFTCRIIQVTISRSHEVSIEAKWQRGEVLYGKQFRTLRWSFQWAKRWSSPSVKWRDFGVMTQGTQLVFSWDKELWRITALPISRGRCRRGLFEHSHWFYAPRTNAKTNNFFVHAIPTLFLTLLWLWISRC